MSAGAAGPGAAARGAVPACVACSVAATTAGGVRNVQLMPTALPSLSLLALPRLTSIRLPRDSAELKT